MKNIITKFDPNKSPLSEQTENDCHIQSLELNKILENVFGLIKLAERKEHKCVHHFHEIIDYIMSLFDVGTRKRPLTKRNVDSAQIIITEYLKQMLTELPGIPNVKLATDELMATATFTINATGKQLYCNRLT